MGRVNGVGRWCSGKGPIELGKRHWGRVDGLMASGIRGESKDMVERGWQ